MPRNGSGIYTLPQAPFVAGTVISSAAVNSNFSDIATALTGSLPRDGQAGMTGQMKLADGSTASPGLTFTNEQMTGLSRPGAGQISVDIAGVSVGLFTAAGWSGVSQGSVPVGMIMDCARPSIPAQWYVCDGSAVSRTSFATLFSVIGATWGNGDGVTTFNLPDLRGRTTFGIDPGTGRLTSTYFGGNPTTFAYGGNQAHTLALGELTAHYHVAGISDPTHAHSVVNATTLVEVGSGAGIGTGSPILQSVLPSMAFSIAASATGVRVNSPNGLDTTYTQGSSAAFTIVPPAATLYKVIYAAA